MNLRRIAKSGVGYIALLFVSVALLTLAVLLAPVTARAEVASYDLHPTQGTELRGYLATFGDVHMLGVEPDTGASSITVTLVYRLPEASLVLDGLKFWVVGHQGLIDYIAGAPLTEAALQTGKRLRTSREGSILQAEIRVEDTDGYTIVLENLSPVAMHYVMTIHGGTVVDEGGQTLMAAPADHQLATSPIARTDHSSFRRSGSTIVDAATQNHKVRDILTIGLLGIPLMENVDQDTVEAQRILTVVE